MATLELQFNCLCLFVPDPVRKAVHVLMPATNGQSGHEGHGDDHKHVVRMLHHSFEEEERRKGRDMEGWALSLGAKNDRWDPVEALAPVDPEKAALPDLSAIDDRLRVDPSLLGPDPGSRVAARITLYSGKAHRMAAEARWKIGETELPLAHQVTWKLEVDPRAGLTWERLKDRADARPPLETLKDLEPEDDHLGYKLRIFHVTEKALPPRGGTLKPREMREHYRAFYPLLGEHYPPDRLLPRLIEKHIDRVNCGSGQASPPPPGPG